MKSCLSVLVVLIACVPECRSDEEVWGTLKGRIVLDGQVPAAKLLVVGPAKNIPAGVKIPDESQAIDSKTKGITNVVIWLAKRPEVVHPELTFPEKDTVVVKLTQGRFDPHVTILRTNQKLEFRSVDPFPYNVRSTPQRNQGFNFVVSPNLKVPSTFLNRAERLPVPLSDDIHNWMRGHLLVIDHPYAAVTSTDGTFEINDLPLGEHEVRIWHEAAGYLVKDASNPRKGLMVRMDEAKPVVEIDVAVPLQKLMGK